MFFMYAPKCIVTVDVTLPTSSTCLSLSIEIYRDVDISLKDITAGLVFSTTLALCVLMCSRPLTLNWILTSLHHCWVAIRWSFFFSWLVCLQSSHDSESKPSSDSHMWTSDNRLIGGFVHCFLQSNYRKIVARAVEWVPHVLEVWKFLNYQMHRCRCGRLCIDAAPRHNHICCLHKTIDSQTSFSVRYKTIRNTYPLTCSQYWEQLSDQKEVAGSSLARA